MYPYIIKEKLIVALGYFLKLILFCSAILSVYLLSLITEFATEEMADLKKYVPDFEIKDGILYSSGDTEQDINAYLTFVIRNDYAENVEYKPISESRMYIVATKDRVQLKSRTFLDDIPHEILYKDLGNISKAQIVNDINKYNTSLAQQIIMYFIALGFSFFYLFYTKAITLLLYIVVLLTFNIFLFRTKLKASEYIKIAIYISTVPILLETLIAVLGGSFVPSADFLTLIIVMIYIYNSLIYITVENTARRIPEELINRIKKTQEDLERELQEVENNSKNDETNEDKKEDEQKTSEENINEEKKD